MCPPSRVQDLESRRSAVLIVVARRSHPTHGHRRRLSIGIDFCISHCTGIRNSLKITAFNRLSIHL